MVYSLKEDQILANEARKSKNERKNPHQSSIQRQRKANEDAKMLIQDQIRENRQKLDRSNNKSQRDADTRDAVRNILRS